MLFSVEYSGISPEFFSNIFFSVSKTDRDIWIHLTTEEILIMYIYNFIVEYLPKLCKALIKSKGYHFNETKVWLRDFYSLCWIQLWQHFSTAKYVIIFIKFTFCSFSTYCLVRMYCNIHIYNVSRIEYPKRLLQKILEKNSGKISEYSTENKKNLVPYKFFCIFSVPKDIKNKSHFTTKMLIIAINLNQFFFLRVLLKEL